jgi:hypothetical protein
MFASALPESLMAKMGKIYVGKPLTIKTRKELLATIKPSMRQYVRPDTGDIPDDFVPPRPAPSERRSFIELTPQAV